MPASKVVKMNNASNITAKWYQRSSQRPFTAREKMRAMPTASVAAPPVRPNSVFSPRLDARVFISSTLTVSCGQCSALILAHVAAGSPFRLIARYWPGSRVQAAISARIATNDSKHIAP